MSESDCSSFVLAIKKALFGEVCVSETVIND